MKTRILCTLLLAGLAAQTLTAQRAAKPADSLTPVNFVSDDDGGVVQIVPADVPAAGPRKAHAVPLMKSVQQVSIFLGSAWADPNVRAREGALADLAAQLTELRNSNTQVLPAAPSVEDFSDLTKSPVNDLGVQRKLVEMLESKAIPAPGSNTVYIVFLAPGVSSSVGKSTGGVHYAAYHSLLHTTAGDVRYIVVPFNENAGQQAAAASSALVETAFNPRGD